MNIRRCKWNEKGVAEVVLAGKCLGQVRSPTSMYNEE